MKRRREAVFAVVTIIFFGLFLVLEATAWARAGGGRSSGSRGSRSFSTPSTPSPGSPYSTPGPGVGSPTRPFNSPSGGGGFTRSPFFQGLAGGLAGGMLGSLLFGGMGHAAPMGGTGGGIGLLDILLIGALLYFLWRFMKRRRVQDATAGAGYYKDTNPSSFARTSLPTQADAYSGVPSETMTSYGGGATRGLEQIRQFDPSFNEESFKETVQDMFFRIQAGWTNRSLSGIEPLLTPEMNAFFRNEIEGMKQQGRINRLENIAIRKVELAEAWQEMGKEYVTVLFTANLLDYTVDDKTGQVLDGEKLNPVKFQEFWTFCRDVGSSRWQLSAIQQLDQAPTGFQQAGGLH